MVDSSLSILNRTIPPLEYDDSTLEKFTFQSVITKLEKPIGKGCPVHIINKITGQVVYKTETDETSSIYVPNLRKYNKYIIIAVDLTDVYNSTVFDLNWDFNSDKGYNYSLSYYDISNLDNIQSIFDFKYPTKVIDPNLVVSVSTPFVNDGSDVSWFSTGSPRRENIGSIPAYYFNGSSTIYLNRNVFARGLPFTFEAYFNLNSINGSLNQYLFYQLNTVLNKYVGLYVDSSLNIVFERQEVIVGVSPIKLTSNNPIALNTNYHVAVCYDGLAFYFFLNGVLQTTVTDFIGFPYYDYTFSIGQQFIGNIGGLNVTKICKYTTNFNILFQPISYSKSVYSDPSDTFAQYVTLLIKNNKLTIQPVIDDLAKSIRFQNNIAEVDKNFYSIQNTFSPTVASYSNIPLGTQDFCIEVCFKLYNKITYPTIVSNQSTTTEWTTNNWALTASHLNQLNKYSFWIYNSATYNFTYPSIFKEQVDIAIVRQGTSLRFYVNGFLDSTNTLAANLNIDAKPSSYLSIGRDINFNLYDFKITKGHCRYTSDYTPKLIDITNKDILETQYQYVNLAFKDSLVDYCTPLTTTYKDLLLTNDYSINGTKSVSFNGTTSSYLLDNWYTSRERFCAEMFVYPVSNANTIQTLFSLYDATSEKFKVGIVNGKLSFNNGTSWTDTSYTMSYSKFNHIVIKREGTVLKVLADGNLVYTATVASALGNPLKVSIGSSRYTSEYFQGYLNNLYIYKNYIKYTDTYTVPVEDIVVDPGVIDERGLWILDTATWSSVAPPYPSASLMRFDPLTQYDSVWNVLHSNTIDFSIKTFKSATAGPVSILDNTTRILDKSPLNKKFYVHASNGTWTDTSINVDLEFLDTNNNIVMVLRWEKDSTYRHGIWYGPSWASLTKAPQSGSYPQTYGVLYFKPNELEFYTQSNSTAGLNQGFIYSPPNYQTISKIRVTKLGANQDYTGGTAASAFFNMYLVKDLAKESTVDPEISLSFPGVLLQDTGSARVIWTREGTIVQDELSFTGELSNTSANSCYDFYTGAFTFDIVISGYGNILRQWQNNLRFNYSISSSGVLVFTFYTSSNGQLTATFDLGGAITTPTQITLTRDSNGYFSVYVNGTKNGSTIGPYTGSFYAIPNEKVYLGSNTLKIYNFNLRKGVSQFIENLL